MKKLHCKNYLTTTIFLIILLSIFTLPLFINKNFGSIMVYETDNFGKYFAFNKFNNFIAWTYLLLSTIFWKPQLIKVFFVSLFKYIKETLTTTSNVHNGGLILFSVMFATIIVFVLLIWVIETIVFIIKAFTRKAIASPILILIFSILFWLTYVFFFGYTLLGSVMVKFMNSLISKNIVLYIPYVLIVSLVLISIFIVSSKIESRKRTKEE
ncbi:hypothetical protein ACJA25_01160 [Mycoplasmopsis hyopharyngis]|uniref:hypothetical protein n=1 Tax=Mycoplasmopsis hyopharyngis TaxID=29558 RepID=UPI00387314F0